MKHCKSATCVLGVLSEAFPDDEVGDIAMNYTCFPMDCDVASAQARVFVDRIKAGEAKRAVMADVAAKVAREMEMP